MLTVQQTEHSASHLPRAVAIATCGEVTRVTRGARWAWRADEEPPHFLSYRKTSTVPCLVVFPVKKSVAVSLFNICHLTLILMTSVENTDSGKSLSRTGCQVE